MLLFKIMDLTGKIWKEWNQSEAPGEANIRLDLANLQEEFISRFRSVRRSSSSGSFDPRIKKTFSKKIRVECSGFLTTDLFSKYLLFIEGRRSANSLLGTIKRGTEQISQTKDVGFQLCFCTPDEIVHQQTRDDFLARQFPQVASQD